MPVFMQQDCLHKGNHVNCKEERPGSGSAVENTKPVEHDSARPYRGSLVMQIMVNYRALGPVMSAQHVL